MKKKKKFVYEKSYGIRKSLREKGMESERMLKLFAHVQSERIIDCQECFSVATIVNLHLIFIGLSQFKI